MEYKRELRHRVISVESADDWRNFRMYHAGINEDESVIIEDFTVTWAHLRDYSWEEVAGREYWEE